MLHTRVIDCGLALWVRRFEPECSNCVGYMHSGLCARYPHRGPALVVKLAERISATIGQENGQENNRRMAKRITGEMLNNFNIKSNMENIEQENNLLEGAQPTALSEKQQKCHKQLS